MEFHNKELKWICRCYPFDNIKLIGYTEKGEQLMQKKVILERPMSVRQVSELVGCTTSAVYTAIKHAFRYQPGAQVVLPAAGPANHRGHTP